MGIPKGITVSQETLHEIMGIMASVPDESLQEIPPGNTRILSLCFTESDQM